ncbi:MAG: tryptophan synthase subunit alpha [bacterium]
MNRIEAKFRTLKKDRRKALITFITSGYPDLNTTGKLVLEMEKQGADIIELGVPFSDPLADGPTIQEASQKALANKITLGKILNFVKGLRQKTDIPLALMTYYNPVYKFGLAKFVRQALKCGVDGVIIPDLPPEEAGKLNSIRGNLAVIYFLSPTSSPARMKIVAGASHGFIYYVSLTGVTGVRRRLAADLKNRLRQIKKLTSTPVAVGFGISTPLQAREVAAQADAIIVGSAIIDVIRRYTAKGQAVEKTGKFVRSLRKAIDRRTYGG